MKLLCRSIVVLAAYLCAALLVATAFITYGFYSSNGIGWDANEVWFGLSVFVPTVSVYALPVALPVIVLTEIRKIGHWSIFAIAGFVLGLLLTIGFSEVPYRGINIELMLTMSMASIFGALIYWLVAWKLVHLPFRQIYE
jgi:hypothetical protein